MRNFYEELEKLLKSSQLTKEQKVQIIKEAGEAYNKQIDNELNNYLAKQYIGAALEIGSAAIPVGGVAGQIAKRTLPAVVSKTIGRKFTHDIATSAIGGGINSSVYGVGRGLMEDKNPFTTALQDGVTGLGTGAALGGITGKIASEARANETLGINQMRKYWGIPFRKASGNPEKAISTLMENQTGFVPNVYNKTGIGNFDIPWGNENGGLGHALMNRANQKKFNVSDFVKKIPDTIINGHVTSGSELHPDTHNIFGNKQKLAIVNNKQGLDRNWLVTAIPQHKKSKQHLGDWTPTQNSSSENGSFSAPSNSELLDNISIHDYILKSNLPEWLNSKASTGITSAIDNYIKSGSDTNIIKNEESPKILEGRVEKWEHINNIILKENNIPINPNTINHLKKPDWTGYKNPLTGDNRIYTAEDIGNMTTKEFGQREKEIDAQIKKMGIPRKKDLSVFGGGTIYIAPYTRADGVQVKGHYNN